MLKQIEGSRAMAEAIGLCRPEVICAYPITPQTHIVEGLGEMVRTGEISKCEFINVESEFAALSVAIGASAAGARAYTATASQGLLYMAEAVYNASGLGLPIVMTLGNRAIGAPINIWNDHSDAMALRESGWIQLFAESNQEAADLHIFAFRLAATLAAVLGTVGLILAVVGVYGVVSFTASQRTRDIGIRRALGASSRDILYLVWLHGVRLVLAGLGVGSVVAWALARAVTHSVAGITASDPVTYISVGAPLGGVALLACWIPARRAMKVDPMVALRHE